MKAAYIDKYGPPDVIQIKDVERPVIAPDEVLIKVHAASINTVDIGPRSGKRIMFGLTRLGTGIRRPKKHDTGSDVAGEVVEVGANITKFKVGDIVYGLSRTGSCAEYAKGSEKGLVIRPKSVSCIQAAGLPIAGLTALQYFRDMGNLRDGMDVMVYGASGGVGTYAVQYARLFDVTITAVCSEKNHKLVKELGANEVIDYTKEDFTKREQKYDLIFDAVGKIPLSKWKKTLKDDGIFLNIGSPEMKIIRTLFRVLGNKFRKKKMKITIAKTNPEDLSYLIRLIEEGKIKTVVDKVYPLDEIADAHRHYDTGHTVGKLIVKVA